jgi:GGDEF domain-containing protein
MNKIYRYFKKLSFFSAIVLIWSVLSAIVLIALNIQTSLVAISILVFIAVLSITRPFPLSSWLSLIVGTLFYAVVIYSIYGMSQTLLASVGMAFLVYLITVFLANFYARQTDVLKEQIDKNKDLLDDLVQYDQSTGILRWKYAHQKLNAEVLRSIRYKKELSLVLIQLVLPNNADISEKELLNLKGQVVSVIINALRKDIDIPFIGERMGIILPETPTEGAQIFAARLAEDIFKAVRVEIAVGIAGVPDDAVTTDLLLENAEMAMKFAKSAGQTIVPASRLREAAANEAKKKSSKKAAKPARKVEKDPLDEPLGPDEWRLEFLDFKTMKALPDLENQITAVETVKDFKLIGLDGTSLAVKIKSNEADLPAKLRSLPQFVLKKVDSHDRIIRLKVKVKK